MGVVLVKTDIVPRVAVKLGFEIESPELTHLYHTMVSLHRRIDRNIPNNSVIFIGDSITQGLAVSAVAPFSVNYGIGNDTTFGVLKRLHVYRSIPYSKALILAIGVNDINRRNNEDIISNYREIIDAIPVKTPVLISAILPVNEKARKQPGFNGRIFSLNRELEILSDKSKNLHFLDISSQLIDTSSNLSALYHIGDGIHLNEAGYRVWISNLKESISRIN